MEETHISFPIVIMKEGEWYVASCPQLDIATQGKTEEEARENMKDLIDEYLHDPDVPQPSMHTEMRSLSFIRVNVPNLGLFHGKAPSA